MIPRSVFVRINRPTPWRNLRTASGRENSLNELPPRASMTSSRASIKGWSGTAKGKLVKSGTSYAGTYTGTYMMPTCSSAKTHGTLRIHLTATKGTIVAGDWQVAALTGTMTVTSPAQFGCGDASATLTFRSA